MCDLCDFTLLLQSTPSLIISLFGLLVTGKLLENVVETTGMQKFPILLQSNCILNFKGNVELLYALYLSSLRQNDCVTYEKYLRYVFDNGNLVLLQSITIGITIGIIGIARSILVGIFELKLLTTILTTSLVTCTITTLIFILLLYLTIEFSKWMSISPDNVILPTLGSLSDFLSIRFLILFTDYFKHFSIYILSLTILSCLCIIPFCIFFVCASKKRMPIQSVSILAFTYILSTFGGYILDKMSIKYTFVASSFPVYSGLAVSISFIYLHKIFTSVSNRTEHNSKLSYLTLIITSFLMIVFYILLSSIFDLKRSLMFYALFILFFIFQVMLLLKLIEMLAKFLQCYDGDIGIISLPIVTAVGDVTSTTLLMLLANIKDN